MVDSLWRYPVKSMMGEELSEAEMTECGLSGDRVHALADRKDGSIASAKRWPLLFRFRAALIEPPPPGARKHPVSITLPTGDVITSEQDDCGPVLSGVLDREVELRSARGAFHDCAAVHLLTTGMLERFAELAPGARFDPRRFRANIVVRTSGPGGFVENDWIGRTLSFGDEVVLSVTEACGRCVMTTLPQHDLPDDPGILRTVSRHNHAHAGVYARVLKGGIIRRGDAVAFAGDDWRAV
jgi:uncharacterized protein YcbX